jgi:hypothetical protein
MDGVGWTILGREIPLVAGGDAKERVSLSRRVWILTRRSQLRSVHVLLAVVLRTKSEVVLR